MKNLHFAAVIALVTLAVPSSVFGQEKNNGWGGRGFVTFNVGAQTASPTFAYHYTTALFGQTAKAGLDTPGKTGVSFEVGAGVRLVQNLGVGVTYSRYSNQRTATLTSTIPNPYYYYYGPYYPYYGMYGSASTLGTTEQMPLQREENAVHIQAIYRFAIGPRLQIGAFGGPSYFRCADDHVTQFTLQDQIIRRPAEFGLSRHPPEHRPRLGVGVSRRRIRHLSGLQACGFRHDGSLQPGLSHDRESLLGHDQSLRGGDLGRQRWDRVADDEARRHAMARRHQPPLLNARPNDACAIAISGDLMRRLAMRPAAVCSACSFRLLDRRGWLIPRTQKHSQHSGTGAEGGEALASNTSTTTKF